MGARRVAIERRGRRAFGPIRRVPLIPESAEQGVDADRNAGDCRQLPRERRAPDRQVIDRAPQHVIPEEVGVFRERRSRPVRPHERHRLMYQPAVEIVRQLKLA